MFGKFTHPETKKGEVFFSNTNSRRVSFLPFQTLRKGKTAFDGEGNRLEVKDWFPVFVAENEVNATSKSLRQLRRGFHLLTDHIRSSS